MNLLILIAYVAYAGISGNHSDRPIVNQLGPPSSARMEFNEKYDRTRIDIDEAEQLSLKSVFRDIENAYTNYQVEVMETAMAGVSNRIDRVQNQFYIDLHWGMEGFLINYFIHGCGVRRCIQFDSPAEFERFVATHTKMAFFLGECYCRRNDFGESYVICLDFEVFAALKKYADWFRGEGKKELEEIARRYSDKWIEHIESEKGFTRRYAYFLMDYYETEIIRGKCTREEAIKWARSTANPLIKCGYTPKWLDDFYDADELAMKSIYHDIENAYTNDQAEAMIQAMRRMPVRFGCAKIRPPFELDLAFRRLFNERFDFRQFCSVSKLERFLAANTEMARFLCSSGYEDTSYELEQLEFKTFKILRQYVDKFHADGNADFEKVAQKFLDVWIEFLESDQGVAHRFARTIQERYVKEGRWTREGALENVRSRINQYIQLGYTPKWLDEFK